MAQGTQHTDECVAEVEFFLLILPKKLNLSYTLMSV